MSVTATQARSRYPTLIATAFAEFDEKTAASSEQQYAAEDQADRVSGRVTGVRVACCVLGERCDQDGSAPDGGDEAEDRVSGAHSGVVDITHRRLRQGPPRPARPWTDC